MSNQSLRRKLYSVVEGNEGFWAKAFAMCIQTMIALSIVSIIVETEKSIPQSVFNILQTADLIMLLVFSVEYVLRLYVCVENLKYKGAFRGRLKYAITPLALVDLAAILPFLLPLIHTDLRFMRAIRLARFFRLFKLVRYSNSMKAVGMVITKKKEELAIALFSVGILLLTSSILMYYIEHEAQPGVFSSITSSLWWGVATLTTVGYGDIYPITPLGKLLGATIQILGIGMFALPAGILASGFSETIAASKRSVTCPSCGHEIKES